MPKPKRSLVIVYRFIESLIIYGPKITAERKYWYSLPLDFFPFCELAGNSF